MRAAGEAARRAGRCRPRRRRRIWSRTRRRRRWTTAGCCCCRSPYPKPRHAVMPPQLIELQILGLQVVITCRTSRTTDPPTPPAAKTTRTISTFASGGEEQDGSEARDKRQPLVSLSLGLPVCPALHTLLCAAYVFCGDGVAPREAQCFLHPSDGSMD
jgi:hypothetical protein